jgi:hypothetical protein
MTATLHPACSLCGLRFGSRPLLDLHIREDHRQRDPGDIQIPMPRSGSASDSYDPASTPVRATKEVTAMTAARPPRHGRINPGPRRVLHALRYANDELTRAFEAIIRSARAPRPRSRTQASEQRPQPQATADGSRDNAAGRAGQAA